MTLASAEAAATRARATADRLAALRDRLHRLEKGDPTTPEDARRARERAAAQRQALATARERLVLMHRSAAARHEENADRFTEAGRHERAERERHAARRQYDNVELLLDTLGDRRPSGAAPEPRQGVAPETAPSDPPDADAELMRLRQGLSALLSWAGQADLDEVDRRQMWCRSIVEQCGAPGWLGWVHAVCRTAASALSGARGVAITVVSEAGSEFVAASDDWTAEVQELELIVGEGPATSAQTGDSALVVDDLATELEAWPGFAAASSSHDIRGLCALPVRVQGICVGSMTVYHHGPMSERTHLDFADAGALADIAAVALVADMEQVRQGGPPADARFIVHMATGAMAARLGVSIEEADSRLRAHAFSTGSRLLDVAREVLGGEGGAI